MKTWSRSERDDLRRQIIATHRTPAVPPRVLPCGLVVHEHPAPVHVCTVLRAVFRTTSEHVDGGTALALRAVAWCLAQPDPVRASQQLEGLVGRRRTLAASKDIEQLIGPSTELVWSTWRHAQAVGSLIEIPTIIPARRCQVCGDKIKPPEPTYTRPELPDLFFCGCPIPESP